MSADVVDQPMNCTHERVTPHCLIFSNIRRTWRLEGSCRHRSRPHPERRVPEEEEDMESSDEEALPAPRAHKKRTAWGAEEAAAAVVDDAAPLSP